MTSILLPAIVKQQIDSAKLPELYEKARSALAECVTVDECKDWGDKAAALATYARQAKDDSLKILAMRIHARARRRVGELLLEIRFDTNQNLAHSKTKRPQDAVSRKDVAGNAGLSDRQRKVAIRIASIPEREFEQLINRPRPMTICELERRAVGRSSLPESASYKSLGLVAFAEKLRSQDPAVIAGSVSKKEAALLRPQVLRVIDWLDEFERNIARIDRSSV